MNNLPVGSFIGTYLVTGPPIYQGTLSVVYPVVKPGTQQACVAKIECNSGSNLTPAELDAIFAKEIRYLIKFNTQPCLPRYVKNFTWQHGPIKATVIITEFVPGEQLVHRPRETSEVLKLVRAIALALEVVHAGNLVHADLKPANLRVRPDGSVCLMDFGSIQDVSGVQFDPMQSWGAPGPAIGSEGWVAPEVYLGRISQRSDIFALGAILGYLLTGDEPLPNFPYTEALYKLTNKEVVRFVKRLTANDPVDRPASIEAVIEQLDRLLRRSLSRGVLGKLRAGRGFVTPAPRARQITRVGLGQAAMFATLGWGSLLGMLGVIIGSVGGAWWQGQLAAVSLFARSSLVIGLYSLFGFAAWLSIALFLGLRRSNLQAFLSSLLYVPLIFCSSVFPLLVGITGFFDWLDTRPNTISWGKQAVAFDPAGILRTGRSRDGKWFFNNEAGRRAVLESLRLNTASLAPSIPKSPLGYLGRHMRAFGLVKVKEPVLFFYTTGCLSGEELRSFIRTDELPNMEGLFLRITYSGTFSESETADNLLFFAFDPRKTSGPSLAAIRNLSVVVRAVPDDPAYFRSLLTICRSQADPKSVSGTEDQWYFGTSYGKLFRAEKPADQTWILAMLEQLMVEARTKPRPPKELN